METKVLEQEEIQAIKDLRVKREQLMSDFGFIEIRIQELTLQKENLTNLLVESYELRSYIKQHSSI
jgi:hypothetical protein